METSSTKRVRQGSDVGLKLTLTDSGVPVDWSSLTDIVVLMYSDEQRVVAGECAAVHIDESDSEILVCEYSADKPQFCGFNSVVVRCRYFGRTKTFDARALIFVERDQELGGQDMTLVDPVVDVALAVEEVSTSLLDNAIAAAFDAAEASRAQMSQVEAEMMQIEATMAGYATDEQTRQTQEAARETAEEERSGAETSREEAETERDANETSRQQAETAREQAMTQIETDAETALAMASAAQQAAEEAAETITANETQRQENEAQRQSNEQGRENAETTRSAQAASDHAQASSDHTAATQDHTQAETDHTRAESDHSTASEDHTASEAATEAATEAAEAAMQVVNSMVAKEGDEMTALAIIVNQQNARIAALENALRFGLKTLVVDNLEVRNKFNQFVSEGNSYLRGAGAPSAGVIPDGWSEDEYGPWTGVPQYIGQRYLNTSTDKWYTAKGNSSVSDWVQDTNA